jgi:hypothetical protein
MFNDLGLTDDQVVAGSTHPLRWLYATIDLACRAIAVRMHVNFRSRALTDEQELKLITLARYGVARFWSRNIQLNNVSFRVDVSLTPTSAGTEVWLEINDQKNYRASYNSKETGTPISAAGAVIYYQLAAYEGDESRANKDFEYVAAHEIGHSILTAAGGSLFSWGHKGTSGKLAGDIGAKRPIPAAGEIDLMKYYQDPYIDTLYPRSLASESDVKNLIYVSRR